MELELEPREVEFVSGWSRELAGSDLAAVATRARGAFLAGHGATIAGGTLEIQRNILGDRVLRLPR